VKKQQLRTISKLHFASCLFASDLELLQQSVQLPSARAQTKTLYPSSLFNELANSILGYKLRTDEEQLWLKIFKNLRAVILNSEVTGFYKKKCERDKIAFLSSYFES